MNFSHIFSSISELNLSSPLEYCNAARCVGYTKSLSLMAVNVMSIIINLVHIYVIQKRLPALRGKPYLSVLTIIGLTDILFSAATLPMTSCHIREWINHKSQYPTLLLGVIRVTLENSVLCRFCALFLSSFDRYFAVCKPFFYCSNAVVRNIGKTAIVIDILLWTVLAFKGLLTLSDMCISAVIGPTRLDNIRGAATTTAVMVVFSACTSLLLLQVWLEIRRVQQRAPIIGDSHLKSSAYYVIAIFAVFVVVLVIPNIVGTCTYVIYKANDPSTPISDAFLWSILISHTIYGIANVVMYGLTSDGYRQVFSGMFSLSFRRGARASTSSSNPVNSPLRTSLSAENTN